MKKLSALALVVAATFAVGTVQAENATGAYLFGGLGWSHIDDDDLVSDVEGTSVDSHENKFGFKVGAGYDFNEYFGLSAAFLYFVKQTCIFSGGDYDGVESSLRTQGLGITATLGYPVTDWLTPYLRFGAGWFHGKAKYYGDNISESESDSRIAPMVGAGLQFNLTDNFALTAEYERIFNAVEIADEKPDYDLVTIGFKYNFGCAAAPVAPVTTTERVTETHTLDAGILFPFDGSVLSDEGKQAVSDIIAGSADIDNAAYSVYGFTDRLGSDAYNQTLSEKRANAVADELTADGVTNIVNVQGFGKSNPVTGDQCDSVKGRKALIDCLQPDRRVEVQVVGDRTVTK